LNLVVPLTHKVTDMRSRGTAGKAGQAWRSFPTVRFDIDGAT
jgi:hypothetical protein